MARGIWVREIEGEIGNVEISIDNDSKIGNIDATKTFGLLEMSGRGGVPVLLSVRRSLLRFVLPPLLVWSSMAVRPEQGFASVADLLGYGSRPVGLGGAYTALADDWASLYYNPAGLTELPGISFSSFYASHLGLANYSAFSLTFRNFGVAALLYNSGSIPGYDSGGEPTGDLSFGNTSFILGAGVSPSDLTFLPDLGFDFALGARVKTLTSDVALDVDPINLLYGMREFNIAHYAPHPPGYLVYVWMLRGLHAVVGGDLLSTIQLMARLLSTATIPLVFLAVRILRPGRDNGEVRRSGPVLHRGSRQVKRAEGRREHVVCGG